MTDKNWLTVGYVAVAASAVLLVAHLAFPVQPLGRVVTLRAKEDRDLDENIKKLRDDLSTQRAKNLTRLWAQPADEVAAATMAKVTNLAQARNLKVVAFRPQRTQDDNGVVRLPYQTTLEGPFPQVVSLLKDLGTSKFKVVVSTVQIASADGATDKVTATVGLVAYREGVVKSK